MRNVIRVVIAVAIILGGQWLIGQPNLYEPIFDSIYEREVVSDDPVIVPMQTEERWLVVIVEFPEDPSGAGDDPQRARAIMSGASSVKTYFEEISGGRTTFIADVQDEIHPADYPAKDYGKDDGTNRDVGESYTDGPSALLEEMFSTTFSGLNLTPYDLDDDGWVDRLLVLHTGQAQEDGGGSNAIWSHYAPLSVDVVVGNSGIKHYSMASFDSGLGTITHEMLHMLGTVDLYDVHSAAPSGDWNGVGDWDIMASGNWNNNGRTPALPTSATLDMIGANSPLSLSIGHSGPENQTFVVTPHVATSGSIRIEIAPNEYIWMESRVNAGFDRYLPGYGLLVTQQNLNVGDIEHNEVNHDSDYAWLKVIEADGDNGLIHGTDSGSSGDVFTSGKFGAEGIEIRDSQGRLVHWTVEVTHFDSNGTNITITSDGVGHAEILPPSGPVRLLGTESMPVNFTARENCLPWAQLTSSDGRVVSLNGAQNLTAGEVATIPLEWVQTASPGTTGYLEGTLGCGTNNPATDVIIDWYVVKNRLVANDYEQTIPVEDPSVIEIVLEFEGDESEIYDVVIEGPLSRIATTDSPQTLENGDILIIEIDPQGLLIPGMMAEGSVQFHDNHGLAYEFNISLQAEPPEGAGAVLAWLAEPANNILVISCLMALWVLSGIRRRKSNETGSATEPSQVRIY
ncbi:MAG: M6 family metalloprotease domain-containing protein [Candidatus Thalassarchaeaceae archaeon]|nr:M6 family metalloprotease domain-containing protein [Candidatus Thalassarchaeaceae archaeon]